MIDTHTHIYSSEFAQDIAEVVQRAIDAGVHSILLPNCDVASLREITDTCKQFPQTCKPMFGLHPTCVTDNFRSDLETIFKAAEEYGDFVAVGEIGLDLYWDQSMLAQQQEAFAWQIDYAIRKGLPMSIHCRNAFEEMHSTLAAFNPNDIVGVLHCFSGTSGDAERIVSQYPHLMFGFNGTFTYKNSTLPETIKLIPTDRIVVETDAPYLAPVPLRGKRNEPSNIPIIIERMAEALGISPQQLEQITDSNATRMFNLNR